MLYSVLTTAATAYAVDLCELKEQVQVDHDGDDSLLNRLIKVATLSVENWCNIALITQTRRMTFQEFPVEFRPDRPPLIAVSSIGYTDTNGDSQTVATATYRVQTDERPGRVQLAASKSWPTIKEDTDVTLTYTCGYGASSSSVPQDLRHAVMLVAQMLYEGCTDAEQMKMAADNLLSPYCLTTYA